MQHKVYPYRKVIGPPVKATNTTVRYPLVCGHMAVRPVRAVPADDHDRGVMDFYDLTRDAIAAALAAGRDLVIVDVPGDGIIAASGVGPDLDSALAAMRDRDAVLRDRATPDQFAVSWGDHFLRVTQDGLHIYAEMPTLEWFTANNPAEHDMDEWDAPGGVYAAGYRFGRHFSVLCPQGEPGFTHVAALSKITPSEFDDARARGWAAP